VVYRLRNDYRGVVGIDISVMLYFIILLGEVSQLFLVLL
jgi:hypothetical protein